MRTDTVFGQLSIKSRPCRSGRACPIGSTSPALPNSRSGASLLPRRSPTRWWPPAISPAIFVRPVNGAVGGRAPSRKAMLDMTARLRNGADRRCQGALPRSRLDTQARPRTTMKLRARPLRDGSVRKDTSNRPGIARNSRSNRAAGWYTALVTNRDRPFRQSLFFSDFRGFRSKGTGVSLSQPLSGIEAPGSPN